MNKIKIRYAPGTYGGWTVSCQCCPSLAVRGTWRSAMEQAQRHRTIHEHRPDSPVKTLGWDGFHYDNLPGGASQ